MKKRISLFLILFICVAFVFSASRTVYVTKTGKKYHAENCRTIKKSKTLKSMTIEEAEQRGYEACEVCF